MRFKPRFKPMINDITTTPGDPPRFDSSTGRRHGRPQDAGYPSGFVPQQKEAYPDLAPFRSDREAHRLYEAVRDAAAEMPGWRILFEDENKRVLEAVAVTPLLRFKDDVRIEVRSPKGAEGPHEVHVRSRSRVGRGDLGANARRIREYFKRLSQVLAGSRSGRLSLAH